MRVTLCTRVMPRPVSYARTVENLQLLIDRQDARLEATRACLRARIAAGEVVCGVCLETLRETEAVDDTLLMFSCGHFAHRACYVAYELARVPRATDGDERTRHRCTQCNIPRDVFLPFLRVCLAREIHRVRSTTRAKGDAREIANSVAFSIVLDMRRTLRAIDAQKIN